MSSGFHSGCRLLQGQTEAAAELYQRAAGGANSILALLKQEPGSLQSPLHAAELHVDALLGHAQTLAASQRCGCSGAFNTELLLPAFAAAELQMVCTLHDVPVLVTAYRCCTSSLG
jgi:hypothetical protein